MTLAEQTDVFLMGGDWNARLGQLNLELPGSDNVGYLKTSRDSMDDTVDVRERELCGLMEDLGFVLLNGRS